MIREFMDRFYRTISFEAGEPFPGAAFRELFLPGALLLERREDGLCVPTTVEEHIEAFEGAVREYPQLFTEGFHEEQTELEWTGRDGVYLVRSGYEKRYARNGVPVAERGINHVTLVEMGGRLRIACAVW